MITIGTWSLSGDYGYVNLRRIEYILKYSYDSGIKSFDTAPNYGNGFAEFCLGNVFNGVEDVEINTKFGSRPFQNKSFEILDLEKSLNDSLYRLRRESVNILWLHNPRIDYSEYEGIIKLADSFKKQGLIKKIGISLAKGWEYDNEIINQFDELQIDCNLLDMDILDNNDYKKPFHARSPFYSGVLSGNLTNVSQLESGDHRIEWLTQERLDGYIENMKDYLSVYDPLNKDLEMDIKKLSRRFLFSLKDKIKKVIFGVKSWHHVKDILDDYEKDSLSEEKMNDLINCYIMNKWMKSENLV
tara:strand:+ start:1825 stop:2724 length:900 start_codon:yes stop_codon:yes gene_type:complete